MRKYGFLIIVFLLLGIYSYFLFTDMLKQEEFPVGIYSATVESFDELKAAGFNWVQTYDRKRGGSGKFIKEALNRGLKVLMYPDGAVGRGLTLGAVQGAIRKYKRYSDSIVWYLADEPDVTKTPAEAIREVDSFIKGIYKGAKTALVVGQGSAAKDYAGCTDIMMVDWYPVPHLPIVSVAENVAETVEAVRDRQPFPTTGKDVSPGFSSDESCAGGEFGVARKCATFDSFGGSCGCGRGDIPVWAVLQAFDWSYYSKKAREQGFGRNPTYNEMRCMTYLSIISGAEGIFYYTFESKYKIKEYPEHWENLKQIVGELRHFGRVLVTDNIKDSGIACGNDDIRWCVKKHGSKRYLITASVSEKCVCTEFSGFDCRELTDVKKGQAVYVKNGSVRLEYCPYGVKIYRY